MHGYVKKRFARGFVVLTRLGKCRVRRMTAVDIRQQFSQSRRSSTVMLGLGGGRSFVLQQNILGGGRITLTFVFFQKKSKIFRTELKTQE